MTTATTTDVTATVLTPYACAKIINKTLADRGVEKVLPTQMFYTYIKKEYIKSTGKRVSQVDLMVWFEKYYAKLTGVKQEQVEEVAAVMQDGEEVVDPNQLSFEDITDEVADVDDES